MWGSDPKGSASERSERVIEHLFVKCCSAHGRTVCICLPQGSAHSVLKAYKHTIPFRCVEWLRLLPSPSIQVNLPVKTYVGALAHHSPPRPPCVTLRLPSLTMVPKCTYPDTRYGDNGYLPVVPIPCDKRQQGKRISVNGLLVIGLVVEVFGCEISVSGMSVWCVYLG